jgi:bisphosphoglycerate-dependent phosphoglycerate mutase
MTDEERETYHSWRRSHEAGPPEARARRRAQKKQDDDFRKRMSQPMEHPPNPELARIEARIAELRAELEIARATEGATE